MNETSSVSWYEIGIRVSIKKKKKVFVGVTFFLYIDGKIFILFKKVLSYRCPWIIKKYFISYILTYIFVDSFENKNYESSKKRLID